MRCWILRSPKRAKTLSRSLPQASSKLAYSFVSMMLHLFSNMPIPQLGSVVAGKRFKTDQKPLLLGWAVRKLP